MYSLNTCQIRKRVVSYNYVCLKILQRLQELFPVSCHFICNIEPSFTEFIQFEFDIIGIVLYAEPLYLSERLTP